MKTNSLFLILFTLLCIFPLVSFGQSKSISKKEFEAARNEAESNVYKKARTETSTEMSLTAGTVSSTTNSTRQNLPPKQSSSLVITKKGNIVEKTEEIIIGNTAYQKQNDEKWIKRTIASDNDTGISTGLTVEKYKSKSKYLLEEIKDGRETFQVYKISTIDLVGALTVYYENKYWIKNALMYKTILNTSINKRENVIYKTITTYNYDLKNLKIEAPTLK